MAKDNDVTKARHKDRDASGRFRPGVSGNKRGLNQYTQRNDLQAALRTLARDIPPESRAIRLRIWNIRNRSNAMVIEAMNVAPTSRRRMRTGNGIEVLKTIVARPPPIVIATAGTCQIRL